MSCVHSAKDYHVWFFTEFLQCLQKKPDRPKLSVSSLIIFVSLFHLVSHLTNYLKCLPKPVLAVLNVCAHHIAWLTEEVVSRFGTVFWRRKSFLQGSCKPYKRFQTCLYHNTCFVVRGLMLKEVTG